MKLHTKEAGKEAARAIAVQLQFRTKNRQTVETDAKHGATTEALVSWAMRMHGRQTSWPGDRWAPPVLAQHPAAPARLAALPLPPAQLPPVRR